MFKVKLHPETGGGTHWVVWIAVVLVVIAAVWLIAR
jgi:LPXTG-motif cell wall-anchored protein